MFTNVFCDLSELGMTLNSMESDLSHHRVSDIYNEIYQWLSDFCKSNGMLIENMKLERVDPCGFILNYFG